MQQNGSYIDQVNPKALQDQAEELMNSLFSEVEQTLSIESTPSSSGNLVIHGQNDFPQSDRLESQELGFKNSRNSQLAIAKLVLNPRTTQITKHLKVAPKVNLPKPKLSEQNEVASVPKAESIGFIDSLLIGSAFTSAIFALILSLINTKINASIPQTQLPVNNSFSDSSAAIAEKLRRSLYEIEAVPTETKATTKLSTNSTAVIDVPQPNVKPIYIPIYQPPTSTPSSPVNPVASAPTPVPVAAVSPKKVLPKGSYTLIGVLDLGDRSSAMFDVNGTIQSIKVGSVVGDSGWRVSRIAQQEVILKKGNEDNTVTVGQKF